MEKSNFCKSVVEHSSVGYSYSKVIYDDKGMAKDYKLIEANKAYETILGINSQGFIGKKFSEIYEATEKTKTTWLDFYKEIMAKVNKGKDKYCFTYSNKDYRVKVHSPAKNYIIICLIDITKESTKNKERILYSSLEFTKELLTNDDLDDALANGLAMLGEATQVDRVYYWENHFDKNSKKWMTSQKFEWCLNNIDLQTDNPDLQNVPFSRSVDFLGTLAQNKPFCSNIRDMVDGKNKTMQTLESQGILSILAIPVFLKDNFHGFIGFDACKYEKEWSQVEISLLNAFALLYTKALEKKSLEESVIQVKENFFNFFNMVQDLLLVLDFDGNIVDINNNVLKVTKYSREELIGQPYLIFHPKAAREEAKKNFEDIVTREKSHFYIPAITKDGHVFPIETNNSEGIWDGQPVIFVVAKDISELSMSEEKFSKAFYDSGVSMFISKFKDGEILEANDTFLDLIGFKEEEVIGNTTEDLKTFTGYKDRRKILDEISRLGKVSGLEVDILGKHNKIRKGIINIVPVNINGDKCLLTTIIDITIRAKYEEKLLDISNKDFLTGIYNRYYIYQEVEKIINEYKDHDKIFSVAIIDLDDFKAINDNYGHQVGDSILIEFANIINNNLRINDILGRYGGEEFIVILKDSTRQASSQVLERILNIVREKPLLLEAIVLI